MKTKPTTATIVNTHTVYCDGEVSYSSHPRVFLEIKDKQIVCPYCSRVFVYKHD